MNTPPPSDIASFESAQLQRGDDTEVVETALEGNPQVWIGFRTTSSSDYSARCENDLELQQANSVLPENMETPLVFD